jgi:hypothetical protein
LVGIGPTRIAELLGIQRSQEAVKWWVRGLARARVPMSQALYETIMNAIGVSIGS